jgi:iron complex outermembrane receptor protein/vitamin B12 transporter
MALAGPSLLPGSTATITVLTRDQIESLHTDSMTEVLRAIPGLHIDERGGRGGPSSLYMRGGEANYTTVLVDGVRVNDPTNSRGGSFDFSLLNVDMIERIEVARGPLPASWGANAIAGAVNIVTRRGEAGRALEAEGSGGRDGYYRLGSEARGAGGGLDWALGLWRTDEGVPMRGSEFDSYTAALGAGYDLSDSLRVQANLRLADVDQQAYADASGGPELALTRAIEHDDTKLAIGGIELHHSPTAYWDYTLSYGLFDQSTDRSVPEVAPFVLPQIIEDRDFDRQQLRFHNRFELPHAVELVAGVEAFLEDGSSDATVFLFGPTNDSFSLERHLLAPYLELELQPIQDLRVQLGVRHDDAEHTPNETSGRVGAVYTVRPTDTELRASWGEGFNMPSLFALGDPLVGNPALRPETSQSFEVGVVQHLCARSASVSLVLFDSEYDDLIDFDPATFSIVNRTGATARGYEVELAWQPTPSFGASGSLTYVDTDLEGTNEHLRNRPKWRETLRARWQPTERIDATLQAVFVGSVRDFAIPTGEQQLDSWSRVDVSVGYRLRPHARLFVAVENLLDASYEEYIGFPAQGTAARAGVRVSAF